MGFLRLLSPFMLKMGLGLFVVSVAAGAPPPSTAWDDLPTVKPADDDWPWWRGPNRDNIAARGQEPPLHWSQTDNVIWKVQVPGHGHGSPCLWGDAVFLPTADDQAEVQYLLCYDRRTGRQRWQTEVHRKGFVPINLKNSHASATPACDGRFVFMPFVIQDAIWLSALGFDGKIVWNSARRLSWPAGTSTWSTRKGWPSFSRLAAGSSWLPGTIWAMAALPRQ